MQVNSEDKDLVEFYERYKDVMPNPDNYPMSARYYWALFQHSKKGEKK
jgi:hypothetical protein